MPLDVVAIQPAISAAAVPASWGTQQNVGPLVTYEYATVPAQSHRVRSLWHITLTQVVQRYIEHNRCAVAEQDFVTDDAFRRCRWADQQRIARVTQTVPKGREAELDAIGFDGPAQPPVCIDSRYRTMVLENAGDREKDDSGEVPSTYVIGDDE